MLNQFHQEKKELQLEIKSLQQKLHDQVKVSRDIGVQFDYHLSHPGNSYNGGFCINRFRFFRLWWHYGWTEDLSHSRRQPSIIPLGEIWIQIALS